MKEPEHHFINEYGQCETKRMWLGSGLYDHNLKKIYEGDRVIFGELEQQGVIDFRDATFGIVFTRFGKENFSPLYALKDFVKIEVIGHVTDTAEENNHVAN